MKKLDNSNYKYIYSAKWANILMLNGVFCRGTGINPSTGRCFWCFDYDECQPFYEKLMKKYNKEPKNN